MTSKEIQKKLFEMRDEEYRLFQAKLMPGVDIERIIGVRTPELRKFAKELLKSGDIDGFLGDLPHKYYDELNLHGFIISEFKDYRKAVDGIDAILPYVDNWATCDLISPKVFKKNRTALKADIERWLASDKPFTIRFGIEMIMSHFLDENFEPSYLDKIAAVKSDEYYVNMMTAWYFATALTKQWDSTVGYIENGVLDKWVNNKTIRKACESYRISAERKAYLKQFRKDK